VRQNVRLKIPLCSRHHRAHGAIFWTGSTLLLLAIGMVTFTIFWPLPSEWLDSVLVIPIAFFAGIGLLAACSRLPLQLREVYGEHVWLSGACESYLRNLNSD
jgi:hypothetical protein